jgi:hypothetical protein
MKRLFLVAAVVFWAGTAFGAGGDNRFALVVGNAAYDGDAALANPVNDANDMADTLASIGWKVTKVLNADRKGMNDAVDAFHDQLVASPNATALLFYAGHGIQISGVNYLIPVRETFEKASDVTHDALSLQTVLDSFADAQVATDIVILDACRDNPFLKGGTRSLGATRGLSIVPKAASVEGSAVLFSTAPGETAQDGSGHNGLFTEVLLKYLRTDLPLQNLTSRIAGEVKKLTGGKQTPFSSLSLSDDFYMIAPSLRSGPPPSAAPLVLPETLPVNLPKVTSTSPRSLFRTLSWVGWGTAAVGSVAAVTTYLMGKNAYAQYSASTDPSATQGYRDSLSVLSSLLVTSAVSAALGAGAGLTFTLLDGTNP